MQPTPEDVLAADRFARNCGTAILIVFLVIEVLLESWPTGQEENIWKIRRAIGLSWRRQWLVAAIASHLPKKHWLMVLAGLGVILGVWIEGHWGTKADQDADQIRDIQQAHIRNAEERLADTTERIAKILVNAGPPRLLGDQKGFWELKQFAGTPFLVQGLPTPYRHPDEDDATFQARYDVFEGSIHGVLSFQQLIIVGWVALPLVTWRCSWMPEQVVIFSRHGNPLEVRLDTPEAKAWSAAEALTQYMRSTGLDAVEHLPIRDDASGNPTDQLAGLILPRNGIFIMVGGKNSNEAIELLEHDLEVRPDG